MGIEGHAWANVVVARPTATNYNELKIYKSNYLYKYLQIFSSNYHFGARNFII